MDVPAAPVASMRKASTASRTASSNSRSMSVVPFHCVTNATANAQARSIAASFCRQKRTEVKTVGARFERKVFEWCLLRPLGR